MRTALLLVATLASVAHADVWQRAIDGKTIDQKMFEDEMAHGDEAATAANSKSSSLTAIRKNLDTAIAHYRVAAKANPRSPDPHFRIGAILHSFFFDCTSFMSTPPPTCQSNGRDDKAREIVQAWDSFEAIAPLDPRVNEILLERAILRTKLVASNPKDTMLLRAALVDYQALVNRADGLSRKTAYLVLGNLAETHMMLGEIDESIETYKDAIRAGGSNSTIFGFAVALDRDDRGGQAMSIIRDLGVEAGAKFRAEFQLGDVFFVPAGEEHYYFALIEEAFGNYDIAIRDWRAFIESGAHPQFHPRAKEHLDALLAKKNLRWRPPLRGM